ncbi:hypothetical protein Fcan01_08965 [Folsomia candida]|uniref:Uncharacterized protein n=1 Tax=Folsomia candida TaxID=158441 RepID=A0A226ED53_FOLCA|nr:hypothetical protein Fcan01_08965 [Folsomia candida]
MALNPGKLNNFHWSLDNQGVVPDPTKNFLKCLYPGVDEEHSGAFFEAKTKSEAPVGVTLKTFFTSEGRQLRRHHDHDYEGSLQETGSRKSVVTPTLIFGNPAVIPGTGRDDATTTTGSSKGPSINYGGGGSRKSRFLRYVIYERPLTNVPSALTFTRHKPLGWRGMKPSLKREAADRKQIDDEIDEDEAMLKKRRQEAE